MIPKEIFKKIRRIEIRTKRLVNDLFSGEYHSTFKGQGMEFEEVRQYQPGDDIRLIDWNVTARTGFPHVKKFREERELSVVLLVDASSSGKFGTRERFKSETAAELCAVLAFSAIKNNDKVGMIIFTDRIEKFIPPKKGRGHVLRLIREILYFRPEGVGTDISGALEYFRLSPHHHKKVLFATLLFILWGLIPVLTTILQSRINRFERHDLTILSPLWAPGFLTDILKDKQLYISHILALCLMALIVHLLAQWERKKLYNSVLK